MRQKTFVPQIFLIIMLQLLFVTGCNDQRPASNFESNLISILGSKGIKNGSFIKPRAIAVSSQNQLYAVDLTGRIQIFDQYGRYIKTFRTPAIKQGKPTGMGFSHDNKLFVADTHYYRVLCYSKDGKLLFKFGKYGTKAKQFVYVTDVAVDKDGSIFVTQYGDALGKYDRIQKFDKKGNFILAWGKRGNGKGEFDRPMSLAIEPTGNILVADACNHRIQRFTKNGKFIDTFGKSGNAPGQLSYPYGIDTDQNGFIYVSEFGNNRIQKFNQNGKSLGFFGIPGKRIGMFANPWDIAVAGNGRIYVADALNHRIQTFSFKIFDDGKF